MIQSEGALPAGCLIILESYMSTSSLEWSGILFDSSGLVEIQRIIPNTAFFDDMIFIFLWLKILSVEQIQEKNNFIRITDRLFSEMFQNFLCKRLCTVDADSKLFPHFVV
jgi:hypothetical protein